MAQSTYVGPALGTWNEDNNWSPTGVPGKGVDANFVNSDHVNRTLVYNYAGPDVPLGTLTIDQTGTGSNVNTFMMENESLSPSLEYIGKVGRGAFSQTGGTHTVGNLELGYNPTGSSLKSNGTYTMGGSAVLNASGLLLGNQGGKGTFNQNGGTATIDGLSLGGGGGGLDSTGIGSFNLSAGTLNAGIEQIDGNGGVFDQSGGDHTSGAILIGIFGHATFTLESGTLNILGNDGFAGGGEYLGYTAGGVGVFNQTGGVHIIKANILLLGRGTATSGTYNLSDGSLTTPLTELGESGTGVFNQSGGTHSTNSLVLGVFASAHPSYVLSAGTLTAGTTTNNGTITQTGGTALLGSVDGTGSLGVTGGNLSATHLRQASLTLGGSGQIAIAPGGGSAGASRVGSLTIDFSQASTARLDLADNSLEVDYNGATPLPNMRAALLSGYAGGTWSGPGLTSSSAAADSRHGLGYAVNPTSIVVSYALAGDGDLNGTVDFQDLTRLAQNYGKEDGTATWLQGDFNYDGNVDFADLVKIAQNYGAGISLPIAGASAEFSRDFAAAIAGVPEPSLFGTVLFAIGGCAIRFRRPRAGSAKI